MNRMLCASALALAALGSPAFAGDSCGGTPGYVLTLDPTIKIGETFHMRVQAPPRSIVVVIISAGPGPTQTPYGTLCVTLPELGLFAFQMNDHGDMCFPHCVPCEDRFIGLGGYFQFIAGGPNPGQLGISNQQHISITDGECGCRDHDSDDDDGSSDDQSDQDSDCDSSDHHDDHDSDEGDCDHEDCGDDGSSDDQSQDGNCGHDEDSDDDDASSDDQSDQDSDCDSSDHHDDHDSDDKSCDDGDHGDDGSSDDDSDDR